MDEYMRQLPQGFALTILWVYAVLMLAGCINPAPHQIKFITDVCIKPQENYDYCTCNLLKVLVDGKPYEVPKGFYTDLASIPKPLWSLISPNYSDFVYPAILHDYMYRCIQSSVTRKFADDVFYSSLRERGVSKFTATRMFLAVRAFGARSFGRNECVFIPSKDRGFKV